MLNSNPIIVSDVEKKNGIAMSNSVHSPKYNPTITPEWKDPANYDSDEYLDLEPSTEDDYFDLEEPEGKQPKVKSPETLPSVLEVHSLKQKQPEETLAKEIPNSSSEPTIRDNGFSYYNNQRVDVWNLEENLKVEMENCQVNKELDIERIKPNVYDLVKKAINDVILKERHVERGVEVKTQGNKKRRKINQGKSANKKPAAGGSKNGYVGKQPYCNRCEKHHHGRCMVECINCKKLGHLAKNCRIAPASNTPASNAKAFVPTCYGCGEVGHFRNQCPKKNDAGNAKARAFVMTAEETPDETDVTGEST